LLSPRALSRDAEGAAGAIAQFLDEVRRGVAKTVRLPWSKDTMEQHRFDALQLLRQLPAVLEISMLDARGAEKLRVSRLRMDVAGSNIDFSQSLQFTEAVARAGTVGLEER
jgi:hypothetical protein